MALISSFERRELQRNSLHHGISASYSVFERDGKSIVQIDTHGRTDREIPGKVSQTIQLDENSARELVKILKSAFRF